MFFTPYTCSQVFFRLQRILTHSFIGCFVSSDVVVYVSIHENKQASKHRTACDGKLCGFARSCFYLANLKHVITKTQEMLQVRRVSNKLYFCKLSLLNYKFIFMN